LYLKRLEIHGFKSFAEKVTLDFRQGLSVVVGPNGSGKSNISDAIRWVIGEQSAKSLRGAKMEDVIFAGSAKRRQVGMAEVSLTLDNCTGIFPLDYGEITVTRRVYRSGDSEYLINKNACRLKDIQELFMDTGIGREGFSIIGQGRVEEILSSKPEERRGMIEEVAGITKYRNRKREASRKLEETEQNLVRLADIISELEGRLDPLRDQAKKAKLYLGLKEELEELELNLAVHDIEDLGSKLALCRTQIGDLQDTILQAETGLGVLDAQTAELKLALQGLDERTFQAQNNCHELSSQIQEAESEVKLCAERTGSLQAQQTRLESEMQDLRGKLGSLQTEHGAEETKLLLLRQTRIEQEQCLRTEEECLSEQSRELGNAEGNIEELKADVFQVLSQTAKHNNDLATVNQQEENRRLRQQALVTALEARNKELAGSKAQLQDVLKELETSRNRVNGLVSELKDGKAELEKTLAQRQSEGTETAALQNHYQAISSRLKILSDLQRDLEGYKRGVKEVLRASGRGRLQGVCGVVADLLKVPARFETAIEVALGGSLQNLITTSEESAKQAISYLKASNFGRATFLPLDALQPGERNFDRQVLQAAGVLGVAADLVEFEAQYAPAVEYLLGRILVVETLDLATKVARLGRYKLRIITLEGDFLNPGGSMTGGSLQQKGSSILGRNREISQLDEEEKNCLSKLDEYMRRDSRTDIKLAELQQAQVQTEASIKDLELILASLEARRAGFGQEVERIIRQIEEVELENSQISLELDHTSARRAELERARDTSQAEFDALNDEIAQAQENIKDWGSARGQLQSRITELRVRIAALEQEEKSLQTALERYYQQKAELTQALNDKNRESQQLDGKQESVQLEVIRVRESIARLVERERDSQAKLLALREERQTTQTELSVKELEEKNLRRLVQEQGEQLHLDQVREARFDTEIVNAYNRLQQDLGLELEQARERSRPISNRREAAIRINRSKAEVAGLGPVNVGAVEEFEQVHERFDFLTTQQQDLLQAKTSLFNVIAEMDRIMVERFETAFDQIKQNFALVFEELFGGGRAELQLTDSQNLLETGVDIIAQPPGKKLQQLSLLSGGEKALTAIALLFAMLKVKPSPFCVLDEIEAALDEANVNRFAAYLKELVSLNQFVVISHRKGTMEAADVLYGVTMEETGVSKLYSVKMAEGKLAG